MGLGTPTASARAAHAQGPPHTRQRHSGVVGVFSRCAARDAYPSSCFGSPRSRVARRALPFSLLRVHARRSPALFLTLPKSHACAGDRRGHFFASTFLVLFLTAARGPPSASPSFDHISLMPHAQRSHTACVPYVRCLRVDPARSVRCPRAARARRASDLEYMRDVSCRECDRSYTRASVNVCDRCELYVTSQVSSFFLARGNSVTPGHFLLPGALSVTSGHFFDLGR